MSATAARATMWIATLAACVLGGACAKSAQPAAGESNTNWLRVCISDDDCGDELSCVCGACTVACEDDLVCDDNGGGVACSRPPANCGGGAELPASACLAECTRDADCSELEHALCRDGVCARPATAECPSFEAGVQTPDPVNATYERNEAVTDMSGAALVDDSGVYYFDQDAALFALPHGTDEPVMLRAPPAMPVSITALVGDGSTLYWGEAGPPMGLTPGPPPPPGWLYAIPKAGGESTIVLQADDEIFIPLGVSEDRIVVSGGGLSLVATDGSSREPLGYEVPDGYARFMHGKIYWTVPWEGSNEDVGYFHDVFRADPLGRTTDEVVRIEGGEFLAGHGFVVWWQERTHFDPLVLDQNLAVFDERTGCAQPLPGVGLTVSTQAVMDGRHAYWESFNGLEGVSPGDPIEGVPVLRADLRSGALEQVVTEGYAPTLTHDTIGQTDGAIYINADGTLVVINKPR